MLMLMVSWEPPAPPDSTPQPDPEPADLWMRCVWIVLLAVAAVYAVTIVLWVASFFRGHIGNLHFAGVTPLLAFPSDLAVSIRRRVYRRLGHRLTAEERRRVYLLEMGKLEKYELEFGAPPLPFQRKEGAEGNQSNRPNAALVEIAAAGRCSGEGRVQDGPEFAL